MNKRIAFVCLLVAGIAVLLFLSNPTTNRNAETPIVAEDYIVAKTTQRQVSSKLTPVMLYLISKDRKVAQHLGCGTLYTGAQGEQVVTCEHLFPIARGTNDVAFRKLRPLEKDITHGIEKILQKGEDLSTTGKPDVVVLGVGDVQPIQFYSHQPQVWDETQKLTIYDDPITLTSLISGEKVRLVGFADSVLDQGVAYGVIEYRSIPGESGTGFIDDDGNLYVLKANVQTETDPTNGRINVMGGLSFVYGAIRVKQ